MTTKRQEELDKLTVAELQNNLAKISEKMLNSDKKAETLFPEYLYTNYKIQKALLVRKN